MNNRVKLLTNIEAKLTGRSVYQPSPIEHISYKEGLAPELRSYVDKECRVLVSLGAAHIVHGEQLLSNPETALDLAKTRLGKLIAHHVYGEIRTALIELRIELMAGNPDNYRYIERIDDLIDSIEY